MLVIVSNRLPVAIQQHEESVEFTPTTGGLASGLRSSSDKRKTIWVGWPGQVREQKQNLVERRLRSEFGCVPVYLPQSLARGYYSGYSNGTLWPLLHSFPAYARYSSSEWRSYKEANALFGEKVVEMTKPGDTVWIHDYHLMLLPEYLRKRVPNMKIGFFLHTPFPPYDTFRLTPSSRELVAGVLGADLVGFHTYDYSLSFLGCVRHLLGLNNRIGQIVNGRRCVQVDVFPLGIDFDQQSRLSQKQEVKVAMARVARQTKGMKIIFSISRLDYTKGIPQQLMAIESLLEEHPDLKGQFVYICVVVPSRERVDLYGRLKREIDELVGRINSRFGTIGWMPIRYVYRRLDDDELNALYASADVALVVPLRDGMNLIAKEYIASRSDGSGVLVLSEMAGASKELLEALIVNPNDEDEIARSLYAALAMPLEEQARRNSIMRARLKKADVHAWAVGFLGRLDESVKSSKLLATTLMTERTESEIRRMYETSRDRLILLDYDGTLVPFAGKPAQAEPTPRVLQLLRSLAASRRNKVFLISGRKREDLDPWFGDLGISLVAEHGAWVKAAGTGKWETMVGVEPEWKERIRPVMELFVDRIPGSLIEEKDFSLAWHYRESDVELGSAAAKEAIDALTHLTASQDVTVMAGNMVVEVKSTYATKGVFYTENLSSKRADFIMAIGDDETDELLFEALPENSVSIKVGLTPSAAKYSVESSSDVLDFLDGIRSARGPSG